MRKIIYITTISIVITILSILTFLTTIGIKTNKFNHLINQNVKEINPKIKLNLNEISLKLNLSNFEFEIVTLDPKIGINDKNIDLETINFNIKIFDYINKKNPITQISILSKENNINQVTDFINEYDFNLARNLILKRIKNGKVKMLSVVTFDEKNPKMLRYLINGSLKDAEVKLLTQSRIENINFDFIIDQNEINLKELELSIDKIFIESDELNIKNKNNQFEITGNFKTNKTKIDLNNYEKFLNIKLNLFDDQLINLSSENKLYLKINNKLKIKDININSKIVFDEIYSNTKYQDFIYLKNGKFLINYSKKDLKINLDSNFLFKNKKYNNSDSKNKIRLIYEKKQNKDALIDINLSNTKNKINSKEFKKYISLRNFGLKDQDIIFSSENIINFNVSKNNEIKNFKIKSKIKTDEVLIDYKSQRIKKYLSNFENQIKLTKSEIDLDYRFKNLKMSLNSKYSIKNVNEKVSLNIENKDNDYLFDLGIDLNSAEIQINELDYKKNSRIKSNLHLNGIYKSNKEIYFNKIQFNDEEKKVIVQNLEIGKNDKIKNIDLFKMDIVNKYGKKNKIEFKKVENTYYLTGSEFDGTRNIKNILDNSTESIFSNFKNLDTYIFINIGKFFIDKNSYLSNINGEIQIKNSKVFNTKISAKLNDKRKFKLNIFTNNAKQKITNLQIERPEPFIKNFKFIKGFKEGNLIYDSSEYEGKIESNLKIADFKVQEVPVLAKLLTLASLQGVADLLTGEGIRFTDFEMDYETLGNTTKIKELYAIGPAISLMMEGYIVKDELTSLRGTLVPATTINKTISKIPMLGEILVGKKIGEGVFGVSFKIKGPPKKLKTSVNPIKTLTPRFITRTLEKISN